eukprot:CFRG0740T1
MSKFWAEESDTSTAASDSDGDINITAQKASAIARANLMSSSESDEGRVVKSKKDSRYDGLRALCYGIKNLMKIDDWASIDKNFQDIKKSVVKAKGIIAEAGGLPIFLVRTLVSIEDEINKLRGDKEKIKKMNKPNAKAFNALRQNIVKYNKEWESSVEKFRTDPVPSTASEASSEESAAEESASDSSSSSSSESDADKKSTKAAAAVKELGSDDDFLSSDFGSDSSSDDSDLSEVEDARPGEARYGASFFLKKAVATKSKKVKKADSESDEDEKAAARALDGAGEGDSEDEAEIKLTEVNKRAILTFPKDTEYTHDLIKEKIIELLSGRGRKGTDKSSMVDLMEQLLVVSDEKDLGPAMHIKVVLALIAGRFDSTKPSQQCMEVQTWKNSIKDLTDILGLVDGNKSLQVCRNLPEDEEVYEVTESNPVMKVAGDLMSFIERLEEELTRSLQIIDPHTQEYVNRLQDELTMMEVIKKTQKILEAEGHEETICRVYIRLIDHMYFKGDKVLSKTFAALRLRSDNPELVLPEETNPAEIMLDYCKYLYKHDHSARLRTRAMLCHIYHLAIMDDWFQARDLMLMSHLQETVTAADIPTQILFNRTMVQLGLCAFRQGRIYEAHSCLHELYTTGRHKELLAQGLVNQRYNEKDVEAEKVGRRRQIPFHMHINLELFECVYMICAMLLEVPNMANMDSRRRVISKPFRRLLEFSKKQAFTGPPENTREHVVAAAKCLQKGDWNGCWDLLEEIKIWSLLPQKDTILAILKAKTQEEGLRTYLFAYSGVYASISLPDLASMYELTEAQVHAIVSKMMINEDIQASWDQPTATIVMHRAEPTKLQHLATQLAEKDSYLVECNERLLDIRSGGYGYKDTNRGGGSDRGGFGTRGRGRGRGGYRGRGRGRGRGGSSNTDGGDRSGNRDNSNKAGNDRGQRSNRQY